MERCLYETATGPGFVNFEFGAWYAPNVLMGMGMFLGIACYGFYRSVEWKGDVTEALLDS